MCHTTAPAASHSKRTLLFRAERGNSWDWLAPFLRDEITPVDDSRCVAGPKRTAIMNAICQRGRPSVTAKEITA